MKLEKGLNVILVADNVNFNIKQDREESSEYDDFSNYMNPPENSDNENESSSNKN